jgi:outer membrane protein assembly factor BamB
MFHGGPGVNGSYSGYFPWSHFGLAWENNFPNTSYTPTNTGGVAPQSSPVVFNGSVYLMASATPSLLQVNATNGNLVKAENLATLTGTVTASSIVSTPLIGEYDHSAFLTVNPNAAGTHDTFSVNLTSGAAVFCHSSEVSLGGSAPIPGGFVEPTRGGILFFSSWALGNNGTVNLCSNVATRPITDGFHDTPSVGLTYDPSNPLSPNGTVFVSDQSTNGVYGLTTGGTAIWDDPLETVANGSLALTNTTYGISPHGVPVVAPIGFIADDGGLAGASHLYAIDVNCGVDNCFSDGNTTNTLPNGTYVLPAVPRTMDPGVNSTVALRTVSSNSTQVIYASMDGTLSAVTATLEGKPSAVPSSIKGYSVNWTRDWNFPTGANFTASPVTANGLVMDGNDAGMFYILNATTGSPVWEHQFPGAIYSSPALCNGQIYVLTSNGTLADIGPSPPLASVDLAPQVTDGWQTPVSVLVNATGPNGSASGPLANAAVTLLVSGGTYTGAVDIGTTYTLGSGLAAFDWTPPVSPTIQSYNFTAFANATGYSMGTAQGSTLAIPPSALLISSVGATPATFQIGNSTFINVTAAGGFLPYTYAYSGLPNGCASQNTSSLLCTPSASGNYTVSVMVSDPAGVSANASTPIDVVPLKVSWPQVTSFSASPSTITLGNSTTFTAKVTGGVRPYSYVYASLPPGCASDNTSSLVCTSTAHGTFNVSLKVTDSAEHSALANAVLTVLPIPLVSYPEILSFTAAPRVIGLGSTTNLTVQAVNGTLPYTYLYGGLPPGCASSSTPTLKCTPIATGNYTVTVTVTDAKMHSVGGSTKVEVNPVVGTPLTASVTANPDTVVVGKATVLTTDASGGTKPYSYDYTGLPAGCVSNDSATLTCIPLSTGEYIVTVTVTDARGDVAHGQLSLVVTQAPTTGKSTSTWLSALWDLRWILLAVAAVIVVLALLALYRRHRKAQVHDHAEAEEAVAGTEAAGVTQATTEDPAAEPPPPVTTEERPVVASEEPESPAPSTSGKPEWSEDGETGAEGDESTGNPARKSDLL